jgi:CRISPR-associated protein Cmr6
MTTWASYITPNLGLLFYKKLYKDVNLWILNIDSSKYSLGFKVNEKKSEFKPFFKDLYDFELSKYKVNFHEIGNSKFSLQTLYPGLLIGSGYTHNSKAIGDASIGFYFDHTTGLPMIPGSSIKGVLRSAFEKDINEKQEEYSGKQTHGFISFLLHQITEKCEDDHLKSTLVKLKVDLTIEKLQHLKIDIFGEQEEGGKDVFYDAVINFKQSKAKKLLAEDFLTPHVDPLKNPLPIQFVKVLPQVSFLFRFNLSNSLLISKEIKVMLFKEILLTLGVGAKTNIGYGQFFDPDTIHDSNDDTDNNQETTELNPGLLKKNVEVGVELQAKVVKLDSGITVDLEIKDIDFKIKILGVSPKNYVLNQIIKVKVISVGKLIVLGIIN